MPILVSSARGTVQLSGTEKVIKHVYDDETEAWEAKTIYVRLDPTVVAEGTNRLVYNIIDLSAAKGKQNKVAKAAKSLKESRQETFKAVVMQKRCQRLAGKFNSLGAPKQVNFIDACIIEFIQRSSDHTGGHPIMIMEPRLEGPYKKYSNNFGYVDKEDRNTPQAFSHFTYQYTNGKMIVVDIQGVKDNYTDPQIHSNIPESAPPIWGQGDMGDTGIYKFFESHRCNALCKFYGLHPAPLGGIPKCSNSGNRAGHNAPALLTHPGYSMYSNVAYAPSSGVHDFFDGRTPSTLFSTHSPLTNPLHLSWGTEMIV